MISLRNSCKELCLNNYQILTKLWLLLAFLVSTCIPIPSALAELIIENFDNGQFNSNLFAIEISGTGPSYQVVNDRLEITLPSTSITNSQGRYGCELYTKSTMAGDYDARVDYTLLTWPTLNGGAHIGGNNCSMERRYFGKEVYTAWLNGTEYRVDTSDTTGTLRLKKTGNTIQAFYLNSAGWQLMGSNNNLGADVGIIIGAFNVPLQLPRQTVKIAFDNLRIYTGSTVPTCIITAAAGANGTISPLGQVTVNEGSNQTFTITPNSRYRVADVLVDGTSVGALTSYTFSNVTAAHTIQASFKKSPSFVHLLPLLL